MKFPATLVQLAEKPPTHVQTGKIFETGSIHFMQQFPATFGSAGRKAPTSFLPFHERLAHITHVEYQWSHTTNPHSYPPIQYPL